MDLDTVFYNLFEQARTTGRPAQADLMRGLRVRVRVEGNTGHLVMQRHNAYPGDQEPQICARDAKLKNWKIERKGESDGWGYVYIIGDLPPPPPPEPDVDRKQLIQEILEDLQAGDPYWAFETAVDNRTRYLNELKNSELLAEHQQCVKRKPCPTTS